MRLQAFRSNSDLSTKRTPYEIFSGSGSPEGSVTASPGDVYLRSDVGEIWVKETGTGNTGWVESGSGTGDVIGPASATDNALARYDGTTGKLIQNSSVIAADTGHVLINGSSSSFGTLAVNQVGNTANDGFALYRGTGSTYRQYIDSSDDVNFNRGVTSYGKLLSSGAWQFNSNVLINGTLDVTVDGTTLDYGTDGAGNPILQFDLVAGKASAIFNNQANSAMTIAGGSTYNNGANIQLFGGSHPSQAGDFNFRSGSTSILGYDASASLLNINSSNVFTTKNTFTVANNQVAAANVTGLLFDSTRELAVRVLGRLKRSTSLTSFIEMVELLAVYDGTDWKLEFRGSHDDSGVEFSITSGGQVQYTSTNITGTGYQGSLDTIRLEAIKV